MLTILYRCDIIGVDFIFHSRKSGLLDEMLALNFFKPSFYFCKTNVL